jgi:hypothetical protein
MRFSKYMIPTTRYIIEKTTSGRGLTVFDIDETLMKTYAQIKVIKNGKIIKKLSNQEFNSYNLGPEESFDFGEFKDAKFFYKTSTPIEKNIHKLIAITKNAVPSGSKVIMLTARADFDDKEVFLNTFRKLGVPIDQIYVERAGNSIIDNNISKTKKIIISKYLSTGEYRRARLYDDYLNNCLEFLSLENELPEEIEEKVREKWIVPEDEPVIEFFAYLINTDGTSRRIRG